MRIKTIVSSAACLLLMGNIAGAATHIWEDASGWWNDRWVIDRNPAPKFSANELSLDLFGSFYAGQDGIEDLFETDITDGHWGGGVGLNYFLTREIGIGGDINMSDNGGNFVDLMQGSLILRLPIESAGLAPYITGGGGRFTEPWDWFWQAGVGLEFRFNSATGIFTDAKYLWAEDSTDRLLLRGGLRIMF